MFNNIVLANLFAFLSSQSIATIAYLVVNYHLLKKFLAPQKISKGFYLATILPIIILAGLYFSRDLDKTGKWVGLALLIWGVEYLATVATLHAVLLLLTSKSRGNKKIWDQIGNVVSANGIAWLVAIFATWMVFIGVAAIAQFFNLV